MWSSSELFVFPIGVIGKKGFEVLSQPRVRLHPQHKAGLCEISLGRQQWVLHPEPSAHMWGTPWGDLGSP